MNFPGAIKHISRGQSKRIIPRMIRPAMLTGLACLLSSMLLSPVPAVAQQASALASVYGRGVHAYFAGNTSQAEQYFSQVIDAGSSDPRPYYFRAVLRLNAGRQFEAENDMRVGANFEARNPGTNSRIGRSLQRVQGPARRTLEKFRRQARLDRLQQGQQQTQQRYEQLERRGPAVLRRAAPVPLGQPIQPPQQLAAPAPGPAAVPSQTPPLQTTPQPTTPLPTAPAAAPAITGQPSPAGSDTKTAPEEVDLFGAPAPVAPADDPFGSTDPVPAATPAPAEADPFGALPAPAAAAEESDPFGAPPEAAPAEAMSEPESTDAPADADPFGESSSSAEDDADPFGESSDSDDEADPFGESSDSAGDSDADDYDAGDSDPFGEPAEEEMTSEETSEESSDTDSSDTEAPADDTSTEDESDPFGDSSEPADDEDDPFGESSEPESEPADESSDPTDEPPADDEPAPAEEDDPFDPFGAASPRPAGADAVVESSFTSTSNPKSAAPAGQLFFALGQWLGSRGNQSSVLGNRYDNTSQPSAVVQSNFELGPAEGGQTRLASAEAVSEEDPFGSAEVADPFDDPFAEAEPSSESDAVTSETGSNAVDVSTDDPFGEF